jgi:hypothetical protein
MVITIVVIVDAQLDNSHISARQDGHPNTHTPQGLHRDAAQAGIP